MHTWDSGSHWGGQQKDRSQLPAPPAPRITEARERAHPPRVGPHLPRVVLGRRLEMGRTVGFFLRQTQASKLGSHQEK